MLYKILIIDDNHSFIDSLKVMLKELPFQYDSAFRFQEADRKIQENQSLVRKDIVKQLFGFDEKLKQWETLSDPEHKGDEDVEPVSPPVYPEIKESHINEAGYLLVIVEHDTETSMKGLSFIQNVVRTNPFWDESDFLLLTSRYDEIEPEARASGVPVIEKPLKSGPLNQFIRARIKQTQELIERANMSLATLENQSTIASKLGGKRARKKSAPEKQPSKKAKKAKKVKKKKKAVKKAKPKAKKKAATKKKKTKKSKKKAAPKKKKAKKAKKTKKRKSRR